MAIFVLQALGELRERAASPILPRRSPDMAQGQHDRLDPRALALRQVVEDIAELCSGCSCAPLNEGRLSIAFDVYTGGFVQGLRGKSRITRNAAVPVAQPAALEIREQALDTSPRSRSPPSHAARARVSGHPRRSSSATTRQCSPMCTPSRIKRDELQGPSSGADCQARSCAVVLCDEPPAHAALARAPTHDIGGAPAPGSAHTGGSRRPPAIWSSRISLHSTGRCAPAPGTSAARTSRPSVCAIAQAAARPPCVRPARLRTGTDASTGRGTRWLMRTEDSSQRSVRSSLQHRSTTHRGGRLERTINCKQFELSSIDQECNVSGRDRTAGGSTAAIGRAMP